MQITYWKNFSKRVNSTLAPSGAGTTIDVVLKDNCTIESPAFILNSLDFEINYIQAFGRYYFVDQIVNLDGHRTMYVCNQDDLATYKADIQASSAMVLYSSSNYDPLILDPRVTIKSRCMCFYEDSKSMTSYFAPSAGYYVLGVVNASGTKFNDFYVMTSGELAQMAAKFLDDQDTVWDDLSKIFLGDPLKGAISLVYLPLTSTVLNSVSTSVASIQVGTVSSGVSGRKINNPLYYVQHVAELSCVVDEFTKAEPICNRYMSLPFVGLIPINSADIGHGTHLNVDMYIDCQSGSVGYIIIDDEGNIRASYTGACGVSLPLASAAMNVGSFVQNVGSAIQNAVTGNWGGAFMSVLGVGQSIAVPELGHSGVQGGYSPLMFDNTQIVLYRNRHEIADYDSAGYTARCGRPLGVVRSLSGLSGYVQTQNASVGSAATESENQRINASLDSGIYIE